jgi:diguanylate cyclase (GGDEF)-like protein
VFRPPEAKRRLGAYVTRQMQPPKNPRRTYIDGKQPCLQPRPSASQRLDLAAIFNAAREVPYEWRLDSDLLLWGDNAAEVLKTSSPEALATGRAFAKLLHPENKQTRFDVVTRKGERDQGNGVRYQAHYSLRGADGSPLWVEDTGCWFAGPDGAPIRALGVVRTINERHQREQELDYLSKFDALTGEINRGQLIKMLETTLEEAVRFRGSCGFLLVAIDELARINDAYGFDVADQVIALTAKRLRARMRGGDCLGRYSGNKFGIILKNCTPDDLKNAADRLVAGAREEVVPTSAGPVAVTVTIGGLTAPRYARSVGEILARAQETLDHVKGKRRSAFLAYRPNLERDAVRRENVRAADEIVTALNERRILLTYEPVVDANTREPAFYECLMRVQRADGSLAAAQDVIPIAERLGLVRLLDHRVAELVVKELIAAPRLRASLNVSPASTTDSEWWNGLAAMVRRHAGVAERLTVEITETAAIHDIDHTRGLVARVKDLGCRIAMDDFGAGYTSFRNLRKLGVDIVKIDGAFVQKLVRSADDRAFVQTLIELARRLRISTVAEWVPTEQVAATVTAWGCDYLQGSLTGLASTERPWLTSAAAAVPGATASA